VFFLNKNGIIFFSLLNKQALHFKSYYLTPKKLFAVLIKFLRPRADIWTPGVNLINVQMLGLRLRLKKASSGMDRGLRLTVIFESYKHDLQAY